MDLVKLLIFLIIITANTLAFSKDLVVGVVNNEPPYTSASANGSGYYGFCVDLIEEICSRLHYSCKFRETNFDRQLPDLLEGRFDLTFFTSPITSTENEEYTYTLPYLPSMGQFMTLGSSSMNSLENLKDKKIGVIKASFLKSQFLSNYTSPANVYEFDDTTLLLNALNSHQVDAVLINSSVAKYLINNVGDLKPLGEPVQFGLGYGISILKKNADLVKKINKILLEMEVDGTYAKLYTKYFGK